MTLDQPDTPSAHNSLNSHSDLRLKTDLVSVPYFIH